MKLTKRFLSLVLSLVIVFSAFSAYPVFAEEVYKDGNFYYTVTEGCATITRCAIAYVTLEIPEFCGEYPVVAIGDNVFASESYTEKLIIPDSVKSIGKKAFYKCVNLAEVEWGSGLEEIKDYAFSENDKITSLDFPDSLKTIGSYAFYNCDGFDSLTIPSNVQTIGEYAFSLCSSMDEVVVSSGVKTIGNNAFSTCSSLGSISIGAETTGDRAFEFCDKLYKVKFTDGAKTLGRYVFDLCENLSSVDFGNTLREIGDYAFMHCGFESITIPDNVVSIGENAIGYCYEWPKGYVAGPSQSLEIHATENSGGHGYALSNGIYFVMIEPSFTSSSLYLEPGLKWLSGGGRFAVTVIDNNYDSQCVSMTDEDNDNIFEAQLPEGQWQKAYFSRYKDNTTENTEENLLNQTDILTLTPKSNYFLIATRGEPQIEATGSWCVFNDNKKEVLITHRLDFDWGDERATFIGNEAVVKFDYKGPYAYYHYELCNFITGREYWLTGCEGEMEAQEYLKARDCFVEYETVGERWISSGIYVFNYEYETRQYILLHSREAKIGDVDGTLAVDINDVTSIQKVVAKMINATSNDILMGDANGNGKLDIRDATYVQMLIAKMIDELPYVKNI